VINQQRFYRPT